MIVVIADDLTGAAEIGGIGLRYNLTVEITSPADLSSRADLLIVNTNSRSKSEDDAVKEMSALCEKLKPLKPSLIFKKVDSVLRGHIVPEIEVQLKAFGLNQALLVPANPGMGRKIIEATYLIDGIPIHETDFSKDPEFPAKSSSVLKMLPAKNLKVAVKHHLQELPMNEVVIGEVQSVDDLGLWVERISDKTLIAGSAAFFLAILNKNYTCFSKSYREHVSLGYPLLYVCGTKFNKSNALIEGLKLSGQPVSYMCQALLEANSGPDAINNWADEVIALLQVKGKAVIAIDQKSTFNEDCAALNLRINMGLAVAEVFKRINIGELIIEGGATASEVLDQLNINKLFVVQELSPGVTRSLTTAKDLAITLKPGSYTWSKKIWKF
jgi:uncharacterized protein YgbK (DUF1537 family)